LRACWNSSDGLLHKCMLPVSLTPNELSPATVQVHEMRAAKEDAERVLGGVVMMYDQV